MKRNIFQNFKLEINYFKHMTYFFDTIYFLRTFNRINLKHLCFLNETNQNILCLNYKDLTLKIGNPNIILEDNILNKKQTLFLLDFKEASEDELVLFLSSYYKNEKSQKPPIVILNQEITTTKDKEIMKKSKYLSLGYYFVLKYGINKKVVIKKPIAKQPKKNKWFFIGFSIFNLLSFIFMGLFGSTTQHGQMNALLESMTYFMNNQPENSRIHGILREPDVGNERFSIASRNFYVATQKKMQEFNLKGAVNSYFLPGLNEEIINFDACLLDYERDMYFFKTKIINQSVYSNQKRILMEKINLEQYLIKDYPFHTPLNGADYVYYMASNVADYLISLCDDDDLRTYSDLIGKTMLIYYKDKNNSVVFEQKLSINNIFYTSNLPNNLGEPLSDNEYINYYGGKDRGLGEYLLNLLGDFGVSTTTTPHRYFGSVFRFDFLGQNKLLKMLVDECLKEYLEQDFQINFFYKGQPIEKFGIFLDKMNNYYKSGYLFNRPNYYLLGVSSASFFAGLTLFFLYCKKKIFSDNYKLFGQLLILFFPFSVTQVTLLFWIILSNHSLSAISLMNIFGSGFSLVITTFLFAVCYILHKKNYENIYEIKI